MADPTAATFADPRLSQPGTVEYYQALLEQRDGEIERLRTQVGRAREIAERMVHRRSWPDALYVDGTAILEALK